MWKKKKCLQLFGFLAYSYTYEASLLWWKLYFDPYFDNFQKKKFV